MLISQVNDLIRILFLSEKKTKKQNIGVDVKVISFGYPVNGRKGQVTPEFTVLTMKNQVARDSA